MKTIRMSLLFVLLCGWGVSQTTGLVAYYPFNGNANDESGNGNDGDTTGHAPMITTDRFGNENSAFLFDGINDYISIPDTSLTDFSYSCWVKSLNWSEPSYGQVLIHTVNGMFIRGNSGGVPGTISIFPYTDRKGHGNTRTGISLIWNPTESEWYHMVVTCDSLENVKIYINNSLYLEGSAHQDHGNFDHIESAIGATHVFDWISAPGTDTTISHFEGKIDDIRIYSGILDSVQISELYHENGWPTLETGLVAYYPFNGNANDESGNGNDGDTTGHAPTLTTDRFGNTNSAYSFDGVDDYIEVPILFDGDQDPISFVAWANIPLSGSQHGAVFCETNGYDQRNQFKLHGNSNNSSLTFDQYRPAGGGATASNIFDSTEFLQWHQIGIVKNQDSVFFYKDGQLIHTTIHTETYNGTAVSTAYLGRLINNNYLYAGLLDDIRIYNRVLDSTEVMTLYHENGWQTNNAIVSMNNINATNGDTVSLSVSGGFQDTLHLYSTQFTFTDYTSGLTFLGVDTANTLFGTAGWMTAVNETTTGLNIASAGANAITEDGVLFNLRFVVNGAVCDTVPIKATNVVFNTGEDSVLVNNGYVYIEPIPDYGDVDENGSIQAYDAAMILKHLVGLDTLNCQGFVNAEVSVNDTLSALDASLILQYVVDSIDTLPYSQPALASGDIEPLDNLITGSNQTITIPIPFVSASNVYSLEGVVSFDESQLAFESFEIAGLSNNAIQTKVAGNSLKFAFASAEPLNRSEELGQMTFTTLANFTGGNVTIQWLKINENLRFNNLSVDVMLGTDEEQNLPTSFALRQNYPNPFNPTTTLQYDIPKVSDVRIVVFDIMGREVTELVNSRIEAGHYQVEWDGQNSAGADLPTGMYFARMITGDYSRTIKMVLMK